MPKKVDKVQVIIGELVEAKEHGHHVEVSRLVYLLNSMGIYVEFGPNGISWSKRD
jgi:hypothetical protein